MNRDVLHCTGLTKIEAGKTIFHDISFNLHYGKIIVCTGAGTHALIRILIGKDANYIGKFQIDGSMGYVLLPDTVPLEQTPLQVLQKANAKHETDNMLTGMLLIAGLDGKEKMLCSELTSGEIRRLLVIREILKAPDLLVLEDMFTDASAYDQKIIERMIIEVNAYIAVLLTASSAERMRGLTDQVINLDTGQMKLEEDGQHNEFRQ
ncbi:transporter [Faecalispora jeddahensis]|uniref:transporter n=1 Tax=Faecalispora jeddahensis TaxID=1414721 RepID=UPI001FAC1118|nr:transporter [Faecalispora jeddahensis]